jgi:hypothetical protein
MKSPVPHAVVAVLLGLAGLTVAASAADVPAKGKADVEVVPNGPIHEAFAQPQALPLDPPPLIDKKPPEPLDEKMPDEKPDLEGVQWIGGYWAYMPDDKDYVWVSGVWRVPPPDRQWVHGYWQENKDKWQRVRGYWAAYSPTATKQELTYLPAPPALKAETPGERPDASSVFIPGAWTWTDATRTYAWEPGSWVAAQPGWTWVSPRYSWTPAGYTPAGGYWDYDPAKRGVVFAPVRVPVTVLRRPGYSYLPTQAVLPSNVARYIPSDPGVSRFTFKDPRFTNFASVPGVTRLRPAQRTELATLYGDLLRAGLARKPLEGRLAGVPRTTVVREPYNLPRPRPRVNVNLPRHPRNYGVPSRAIVRDPARRTRPIHRLTSKPGVKTPRASRKPGSKRVTRPSTRKKPTSRAKPGLRHRPKKPGTTGKRPKKGSGRAGKKPGGKGKSAGKGKKGGKKPGKKPGGKKKGGKGKKGGKKPGGKKKGGKGKKGGKKKK